MRVDGHSLATVSTHSRPKAAGGYRNVQGNFLTGFNTQPPEGGWFCFIRFILIFDLFQHTAARRRLGRQSIEAELPTLFQHTAARRRLVPFHDGCSDFGWFQHTAARRRLEPLPMVSIGLKRFQHTAARRRLETVFLTVCSWLIVSTHSRPKAAGIHIVCRLDFIVVSTHSRPKAAGSYAV